MSGRLVLVWAPAGWGKTVLLAQWRRAERGHRPFAWVSLDPADDDPVRFWNYVVAALRTVVPGFGGAVLAALPERRPRLERHGAAAADQRARVARRAGRARARRLSRAARRAGARVGRLPASSTRRATCRSRWRRGSTRRWASRGCARRASWSRSARTSCGSAGARPRRCSTGRSHWTSRPRRSRCWPSAPRAGRPACGSRRCRCASPAIAPRSSARSAPTARSATTCARCSTAPHRSCATSCCARRSSSG